MCRATPAGHKAQAHRGQQLMACNVQKCSRTQTASQDPTRLPPSARPKLSSLEVLSGFRSPRSSAFPGPPVRWAPPRAACLKLIDSGRQVSQSQAASRSAESALRSVHRPSTCARFQLPHATTQKESLTCRQLPDQTLHHSPMSFQTESTTLRHSAFESTPNRPRQKKNWPKSVR